MDSQGEFTWAERRPRDGQEIDAYSVPLDQWFIGYYYNDGIDGIIEWENGDICEIEEYGKDTITKWKSVWS